MKKFSGCCAPTPPFFHLINKAEQLEITAINRKRETQSTIDTPRAESIAEGIYHMKKEGYTLNQVLEKSF